MKQCGEVLWGIRKDFREKNNVRAASTAHYSEQIDVRKDNREMFGIEDGESYEFRSAWNGESGVVVYMLLHFHNCINSFLIHNFEIPFVI